MVEDKHIEINRSTIFKEIYVNLQKYKILKVNIICKVEYLNFI